MNLNNLIKKYSFKKAQQLVEFALVAPILILFLLLIMEFGYVITIRNVLSEGAKESLMLVNNKFNNLTGTAAAKKSAMETELKNSMEDYLETHNIANASNVAVTVTTNATGVSFVTFTYMYTMILTLIPNLPAIAIQTSQIINTQMLEENDFNSGLTTADLSSFFAAPSGALTTGGTISGFNVRDNTAILVNWYANSDLSNVTANNYARLYSWYGEDLLPPNTRINTRTATIYIRSPYYNGGNWLNTQIPYVWVVAALGYTQVLYAKYNSTIDVQLKFGSNIGYTLNSCDIGDHYWSGAVQSEQTCPLVWGQGAISAAWYPYLYRINPLDYDDTETLNPDPSGSGHQKFMRSSGYRWCGTVGNAGLLPACTADQSGSHTIQELALKGISREGILCSNHGIDYKYNAFGNYEYVKNTVGAPTLRYYIYTVLAPGSFQMTPKNDYLTILQHYTVRTSDYNNYDGNYAINIFQPAILNGAGNYLTAGTEFVDPAKMILNSGSDTPLFTAFQWEFRLDNNGVLVAGVANTDIVDVYMDTDGDGIPDAWDDHPTYFDANGNAILDGSEFPNINIVFNGAPDTELNQVGAAYVFADAAHPVPGVTPIIAPPYQYIISTMAGDLRDSKKNNGGLRSYIPQSYYSDFRVYNSGAGNKLYIECDADTLGNIDDLCRQFPTWDPVLANELLDKSRFIHGTSNGAVINLNRSTELNYLDNNNFSAANRVTRTPAGW